MTQSGLNQQQTGRALGLAIWDGVATQVMVSLASGVVLVGLALELEASNLVIGILAALPFLSQLLQVPGVVLVEKIRIRRLISTCANGAGRAVLLAAAATPFIPDTALALTLLLAAVAVRLGCAAISNCAWNSWMRDIVPEGGLGGFYSRKLLYTTTVAAVLTLAAGGFIDLWGDTFPDKRSSAYTILLALGALAGLAGVWVVSRTPEPPMAPPEPGDKLLKTLLEPVRDANFRQLLVFLASWEFAINLAAPFFTVYLLKRLGYPMSLVIVFTVLSQIANIAFVKIWGRLTDRYNNKSVLSVCGPLFILCIFGWTFVTFPDVHAYTIPLLVALHILMGISTAGVALASNNIGLKLAPKGKATAYLATRAVASSLAGGIAPIIGGAFADLFVDTQFSMSFKWEHGGSTITIPALIFSHWDFFFLFAAALGLYSLHRLSAVREIGEVEERIIVEELLAETRQTIGNVSTAAGLRMASLFSFDMLRARLRRPD